MIYEIDGFIEVVWELGVVFIVYSLFGYGWFVDDFFYQMFDDFLLSDFCCMLFKFQGDNFYKNCVIVEEFKMFVGCKGCILLQVVFVWVVVQGMIVILGMIKLVRFVENFVLCDVELMVEECEEMCWIVDVVKLVGNWYGEVN